MTTACHSLPPSLVVTREGPVAIIRLARAHKRNALDAATVEGLSEIFCAPADGVKAFVLHGEGEHFCAGLDLGDVVDNDVTQGVHHSRLWHRAFGAIEFGPAPVVSVLHGAVVGGGLELAAATHIRVAERSTFYALPEGQRGIFVGGGGSVRIPRLIGVSRMQDMMLTGRTLGAEEGLALGLSHYLAEPGAGLARGIALAHRIAQNTGMTNFAVTHVLPRIADSDPAAGYMMEALIAAIAAGDSEAKVRLADFLAKRAAKVDHKV